MLTSGNCPKSVIFWREKKLFVGLFFCKSFLTVLTPFDGADFISGLCFTFVDVLGFFTDLEV